MPETLTPPQQEHKVVSVPPDAELSQWTEHRVADGQVSELAQLDTSLTPPEDSLPTENQEARGQAEQLVPDGFKSVAEQLYEETDLAKRKELKAQAAVELKPTLDSLDDEAVEDYLAEDRKSVV